VNIIRHWLQHPRARLIALMGLVLVAPLCLRAAMGWSDPLGYLSDLGIGSLLVVLLHRRPWWLALPVLLVWGLFTVATAELVSAVGRLPNAADLNYLIDPQFLDKSTSGSFAQPWLAASLLSGLLVWLLCQWAGRGQPAPAIREITEPWQLADVMKAPH
jgi:hypothetical protein